MSTRALAGWKNHWQSWVVDGYFGKMAKQRPEQNYTLNKVRRSKCAGKYQGYISTVNHQLALCSTT